MAEPVLSSGQYALSSVVNGVEGSSFVYGGRGPTGTLVGNTQADPGTLTVQDQAVVGHDGILFGVDTLPGMIVTQTGQVWMPNQVAACMDAYSTLAGVWNDPAVRLANGAHQIFRAFYPGSSVTRRCYGRGRKIMPTLGQAYAGLIPFTAQFQAADNTWYSDVEFALNLTQVPSYRGGGIVPPVTPPYQMVAQTNFQQNVIANTGSLPTWPVITFTGPISYPGLTYVNTPVSIGYNGILKASDTLVIDTRPWNRTALLNGISVAGAITGNPMISLQAWPGSTVVRFTGQDFTGTSTCVIKWRNAFTMIGGSS
ncbi:MAG TPA: hypothetical protein VGI66_01005 [Streptosporangiaceae bacterium]|jgi:hypothetical protein